jgi:hypothetical protein
MRAFILLVALILAGCEDCPPSFKAGELVKHRMDGWTGIVLRDASSVTNYQGYCLVDVRPKDGGAPMGSYATAELERL